MASLASHKLRSALTMLGMIFGVGAVIAMLAIGAGAEQETMAGIERLGLRNLIVRAKEFKESDLREIREKSLGVSPRDLEAVQEAVPGIERAAGRGLKQNSPIGVFPRFKRPVTKCLRRPMVGVV